jgi:hypothetical protein
VVKERKGEREKGRMGEWENGRMGEWEDLTLIPPYPHTPHIPTLLFFPSQFS